jgi:hypothetical protein
MHDLLASVFVAFLAFNNLAGQDAAVQEAVPDASASAMTIYRYT